MSKEIDSCITFRSKGVDVLKFDAGKIYILGEEVEDREKIYDAFVSYVRTSIGESINVGVGWSVELFKLEK